MPTLYYSNHLEELVTALEKNLQTSDPFLPHTIVVPNLNLQRWLSLEIAKRKGIFTNYQFFPLEQALSKLFLQNAPSHEKALLPPLLLQRWIITIVQRKLQENTLIWKSVRDYLHHSQQDSIAFEKRMFQFAERLTYIFLEYGNSREDMIQNWEEGNFIFGNTAAHSIEQWQSELWQELFGKNGIFSLTSPHIPATDKHYLLFPQLTKFVSPPIPQTTQRIHLFGLSYISRLHQRILTKLDEPYSTLVYALNPCKEFWDDLSTHKDEQKEGWRLERITRWRTTLHYSSPITQKELENWESLLCQAEQDEPLLRAWGRPGRENIHLLNQWANWKFENQFIDPRSQQPTLLQNVQYHILQRNIEQEPSKVLQDDSLQVIACPSIRREIEIITHKILHLMAENPTFCFHEMAIITTNMEKYQPELERTLHQSHIPYNLIDGVYSSSSRLAEGVLKLLELGQSSFTRSDVFALLLQPNFLHCFDINDVEAKQWLQWAEELSIYFGTSQQFNVQQGYEFFKDDLYNWQQGMNRLTLGTFFSAEKNGVAQNIAVNDKRYYVPQVEESQHEDIAKLQLIISSLFQDTEDLVHWKLTASEWATYFQTLIKTYLAPIDSLETKEWEHILRDLASIRILDEPHAEVFSYTTILEFYKKKHQQSTIQRGTYLADGVTISSFLPMRPIPFPIVFIVGLGEGEFPRTHKKDHLDLRSARIPFLNSKHQPHQYRERELGDVSNTEKDQYMFLEILISTRQQLVLTYVAQDSSTGETQQPSSIIQTLLDTLHSHYLGSPFAIEQHPLKRYATEYFQNDAENSSDLLSFDAVAFGQWKALEQRQHLQAHLSLAKELTRKEWFSFYEQWQQEEQGKPLIEKVEELSEEPPQEITISIHDFLSFLRCPLQSSAKKRLHLRENREENLQEKNTEPLEIDKKDRSALLRTIFEWSLHPQYQDVSLSEIYLHSFGEKELKGNLPTGELKYLQKEKIVRAVERWQVQIQELLSTDEKQISWTEVCERAEIFRFGDLRQGESFQRAEEQRQRIFPPLQSSFSWQDAVIPMEWKGKTHWSFKDNEGTYHLIHLGLQKLSFSNMLGLMLDATFLQLAGVPAKQIQLNGLSTNVQQSRVSYPLDLSKWNQQSAKTYLQQLASDIWKEPYGFLFPIEAINRVLPFSATIEEFEQFLQDDPELKNQRFQQAIQKVIEDPYAQCSSRYGPIQDLENYAPPQDCNQLFEKRFLPLYSSIKRN